jgi:hypothetical protein
MNNTKKTLLILSLLILAGCATPSTYHWGSYEGLVHDMYMEPGNADAATQTQRLTADIEEAASKGKPTPPGVHAHLGYMYSLQGYTDNAKSELLKEKALYPEASVFIDGMIARAFKGE